MVFMKLLDMNVEGIAHVFVRSRNKYGHIHFESDIYAAIFYFKYRCTILFDNIAIGPAFNDSKPVSYTPQDNDADDVVGQDYKAKRKQLLKETIDLLTLEIVEIKKQTALLIREHKLLKKMYTNLNQNWKSFHRG